MRDRGCGVTLAFGIFHPPSKAHASGAPIQLKTCARTQIFAKAERIRASVERKFLTPVEAMRRR
ncbi:MAG: hypothetical protein N2444_05205 [Methylocystis sp.]|nr:hypothetical protein [Methylocystis sp.]